MGRRKYTCNFDFFERIDCENKAYWLGFLAADGCIRDDSVWVLALHSKDRHILEQLKKDLNATYPVKNYVQRASYTKKNGKIHSYVVPVSRVCISSKKMVADLASHGIMRRKTFRLEFPSKNQVPAHLVRHFVRGYFDGDGCLSRTLEGSRNRYRVEIISSKRFILGMAVALFDHELFDHISYYKHPSSGILALRIADSNGIKKFERLIYEGATTYLERKRSIFDEVRPVINKSLAYKNRLLYLFRTTQEAFSFHSAAKMFDCGKKPSKSWFSLRHVFSALISDGSIVFSHKEGPHKFFRYDFEETGLIRDGS